MPPDLEIRVLFCYSPEVLANTYISLNQLKEDNEELCSITQDIFQKNIITYNVKVKMVNIIEIGNLQMQYGIPFVCLSIEQAWELTKCTLQESIQNNNPNKFGGLPAHILRLKNANRATVVVLQVLLCVEAGSTMKGGGVSSKIGVQEGRECVICVYRTINSQGLKTSSYCYNILAHELGHLMGCRHPYGFGVGFDSTPSKSHGHCIINTTTGDMVQGTIMSYAKNVIPYYSNPYLFRYSQPNLNQACGVLGESEACLTVNHNIQKLAGIF